MAAVNFGSQNVAMRIIRHESFNAFVVDGHNVFINTGTLTQAKTPNEVIGVSQRDRTRLTIARSEPSRGGFPAVILAPLSFEALYLQQQQNAAPTQLGPRIEVARN